ncbi:MAG: AsmA family protein [Elusimicrobia bacterium]|nr:AsmA family protein [Elusimicrobiota bacterium]
MPIVSPRGLLKALLGLLRAAWAVLKVSMRVVVLALLTVALALGTAYFLVQKIVTPDDVAALSTTILKDMFRSQVQIESAKLDPLRGISLDGLRIYSGGRQDGSEFLSVDNLVVDYEWLPLLQRKLVIKEITVNSPHFNLIRREDGTWNIPEISSAAATATAHPGMERSVAGIGIKMDLAKLQMKNATLRIRDQRDKTVKEFYNGDFRVWNFSPDQPFPFRLASASRPELNGKPLDVNFYSEGKAVLASFNLAGARLSETNIELSVGRKPIYATLELSDLINPELQLHMTVPYIQASDFNFAPWYPGDLRIPSSTWDVNGSYFRDEKNINLRSVRADVGSLALSGSGWYKYGGEGQPEYRFSAETREVPVADVIANWPPFAAYLSEGRIAVKTSVVSVPGARPDVSRLEVSVSDGKARWRRFAASGINATMVCKDNFSKSSVTIRSAGVKFLKQEYSRLSGWIGYGDDRLEVSPLRGLLNGSPFRVKLDIKKLSSPKREIEMNTYFAHLKLMDFFTNVAETAEAIHDGKPHQKAPKATGQLAWLRNFRAAIPSFMSNFKGTITADNFDTPMMSGRNLAVIYDLKGLLPGMAKLNGSVDGQMSNGIIHQLDTMSQREKALGIAYTPFVMLNKMEKGGAFKVGSVLKDVAYRKMVLSADFKAGNMKSDNFVVDGPVLSTAISGNINWPAETMNITVDTLFSAVSKHSGLSESMTDESGKPALSFAISGEMEHLQLLFNRPKKVAASINNAVARGAGTQNAQLEKLAGGGK